jgi:uncharacterized protein (TIGR02611 family)
MLSREDGPPLHEAGGGQDSLPSRGDKRVTVTKATLRPIRRIAVTVVGGTVLALGIALIVLPGPAFIVIPAGLAILAIEFAWARRWLRSARAIFSRRSKGDFAPRKKLTMQSVRRRASFLLRQFRRTPLLKK